MNDDLKKKVEETMNAPEPENAEVIYHSPGPWQDVEDVPDSCDIIVDANGESVISDEEHGSMVAFMPGDQGKANKRLVLAAPDLLEALENIADALDSRPQLSPADGILLDHARAALAKAKGE